MPPRESVEHAEEELFDEVEEGLRTPGADLVWPPRPMRDESLAGTRGTPGVARPRRGATGNTIDADGPTLSAWEQFERVWLGVTRPPLRLRAWEAGWTPEPANAACPRCAASVGEFEADDAGCPACRGKRLPWSRAVRLGEYTGLLRDVVHDVKFTAWRSLGREAGRWLGAVLASELDEANIPRSQVRLAPVPTTLRRLWTRGIDHTLAITRGVRDVVQAPITPMLRREHREPQVSLSLTQRKKNLRGSMRARPRWRDGEVIVVIDDVRTTGATLAEATGAIHRAAKETGRDLPRVWVATLAVTPDARRRAREGELGSAP